jgi:hypothetical protein
MTKKHRFIAMSLFTCTLVLEAGIGCSSPSISQTPGATANATPASCPAPGPTDQMTLTKKDGNCDTGIYGRTMALPDNDVCIVTQAPPGSCSATFTCSSKMFDATTQAFTGNITLTAAGTATGTATVTITNADGSQNCTGNYAVTIDKS